MRSNHTDTEDTKGGNERCFPSHSLLLTHLPKTTMRLTRFPLWLLMASIAAATLADEPEKPATTDPLREVYREDAEKCAFSTADGESLKLVNEPIMRWTNDGDWSGDVFVWTHKGRPELIGCLLSGPGAGNLRYIWHEFHLLAEKPIAPATIQNGRRWEPAEGLKLEPAPDAPQPAQSASARLVQMRSIARSFTPYMAAESTWELRLLPQPLLRYGEAESDAIDGALFAYVWPKGTDPEFILLLECRRTDRETAWYYAPVRFSNRALWLKHGEKEVWRVAGHGEPKANATSLIYTTGFARAIPRETDDSPK